MYDVCHTFFLQGYLFLKYRSKKLTNKPYPIYEHPIEICHYIFPISKYSESGLNSLTAGQLVV